MVDLARAGKLPITPIWSGDTCWVLQDSETPMPGFYVISPYRHVFSIADLTPDEYMEYTQLIFTVRTGMRDVLGIKRAHIYQEEKATSHLHAWILPIWNDAESIRISKNNINDYMDRYDIKTHGAGVTHCADLMRNWMKQKLSR